MSHTRILFLSANPTDTGQLRLGTELRDIKDAFRGAKNRDSIEMHERLAVRTRDLRQAMLDVDPHIVHFAGHGVAWHVEGEISGRSLIMPKMESPDPTRAGGIVLEDDAGHSNVVSDEKLAALLGLFSENLRCLVLNACYSEVQAKVLIRHVPYIVAMKSAVPDETAIRFAVAFYESIGAGRDVPFSFRFAMAALGLEDTAGAAIPVLIEREAEL